jgi:hypothetical protein
MDNYYIFTTTVYNTLNKDKIYSRYYDVNKENVVLLATETLSGFSEEFSNESDTVTYINKEGGWPDLGELAFEDKYIPSIDD